MALSSNRESRWILLSTVRPAPRYDSSAVRCLLGYQTFPPRRLHFPLWTPPGYDNLNVKNKTYTDPIPDHNPNSLVIIAISRCRSWNRWNGRREWPEEFPHPVCSAVGLSRAGSITLFYLKGDFHFYLFQLWAHWTLIHSLLKYTDKSVILWWYDVDSGLAYLKYKCWLLSAK